MSTQLTYQENTLTLTVTRRLALRFAQGMIKGTKPQKASGIYALNDWYTYLWTQCQARGLTGELTLLSPIQEQAIWLSIIEQNEYGVGLLRPQQTAKQLMNTFKLIGQWQLDIETMDWGQHEESLIFKEWASAFMTQCQDNQWLSLSLMPDTLLELFAQSGHLREKLIPAARIQLAGFDDYPPQVKAWLDALQGFGKTIEVIESNTTPKKVERFAFENLNDELYNVAQDAKEWVKTHEGVYAIVVPELMQQRSQVEKIFNEVCDTQALLNPEFEVSWQYNISAGLALIEYPVIHDLLLSLKLLESNISLTSLCGLLQSAFIKGHQRERNQRIRLCHELKKREQAHFTLCELLELPLNELPIIQGILKSAQSFKHQLKGSRAISEWHACLLEWFALIDWPGERRLNSPEFQVVQRFYALLNDWRQLDVVKIHCAWYEALGWLKNILFETSFQPESNPVRIQIMGLLEASGQQFEKLHVLGLHSEVWPASPAPNPFLPMDLQVRLNMPHACSARELTFAQHLTKTLMHSANHVVFSHAKMLDGKEYHASPLIQNIEVTQANVEPFKTLEQQIYATDARQIRPIEPPIPVRPDEEIYGGTALIEDQSNCPFKAFAKNRLHIQTFEPQDEGITALERGNVLHTVLQRVWGILKDHKSLIEHSHQSLRVLVEGVIDSLDEKSLNAKSFYWEIEKQRLLMLVLSWLELEKQREPFKVVKTEAKASVALKGMSLNCRLDRVDITEDGQPIIIDYKTGNVTLNSCFGERPDSPQLPLYCFANFPNDPQGIVYAIVRRDGCQFLGVSAQDGLLPNVKDVSSLNLEDVPLKWDDLMVYFKDILDELSEAFMTGHHEVDPSSPKACLYCDLSSLCRVMEQDHG